jgi:D-sedoheptulose 7-phosphate isomerase
VSEGQLESYRRELLAALNAINLSEVAAVANLLIRSRHQGGKVFVVGNGGSAATASHMANDLMLGTELIDPPMRVIALTDSQTIMTATGNDLDFRQVFSRPFSRLADAGDVLIAISASGNSPNVLKCIDIAQGLKVITVGLTGFDGGELARVVDLRIHVPTCVGSYGPVEDAHLAINHMITNLLKDATKP